MKLLLIALSVVFRGEFVFGAVIACFFIIFGRLVVLTYVIFEKAFGGVAVLFDLGFVLIPIAEHKLYKIIYHQLSARLPASFPQRRKRKKKSIGMTTLTYLIALAGRAPEKRLLPDQHLS
jgi:hypothetical protein